MTDAATASVTKSNDETEKASLSLEYLIDRLGEASGTELFERMDIAFRSGDRISGTLVRDARSSFSAARIPGHARLVIPGRTRSSSIEDQANEGLVVIALSDLEAVVKASQSDFDWAAEFAPRADLPIPTTTLVVRTGATGRRMLQP